MSQSCWHGGAVQLCAAALLLSLVRPAHAEIVPYGTFSAGTGTFSNTITSDDKVNYFRLELDYESIVSLYTTSFATSDPLNSILGGFSPVLTLFAPDGTYLLQNNGATIGNCGTRAVDSASGYCLDAALFMTLDAGIYTLALSQDPNISLGDLSGGFQFDGQGNFTAALFSPGGESTNPCWLFDNTQRGCNWSVTSNIEATPEPSSIGLLLIGLAVFAVRRQSLYSNLQRARL